MIYAGFWRRFFAGLIDLIVLSPILAISGFLRFGIIMTSDLTPHEAEMHSTFLSFITISIIGLYFVFMEISWKQATIGKLAIGIRITDVAGDKISFFRAFFRNFLKMFWFFIFFFALYILPIAILVKYNNKIIPILILIVGIFISAAIYKERCLYDKLTGTAVLVGRAQGTASTFIRDIFFGVIVSIIGGIVLLFLKYMFFK